MLRPAGAAALRNSYLHLLLRSVVVQEEGDNLDDNGVVGVARRSHSCKLGEICSTAGLDVRIRQLVCVEAVVVVPKHALVPSIKCKK